MTNKTFSVYVHIPFCLSKCKYCAFYSEKYTEEQATKYANALKKCIVYFADNNKTDKKVCSIYFGGGTPTSVGAFILGDILDTIKSSFMLTDDCEITVEANPKTVCFSDALLLKEKGFNRISLGIQTTNNDFLETLGRIHTFEDAQHSFNLFKKAGFENLSVDLMYGLPSQTKDLLFEDLKNLCSLNPSHISTYALSLEDGTYLYNNKNKYDFPDEDIQFEYYMEICSFLKKQGFSHYEISNFAKEGFYSRHNCGYWERRDYIGFGTSAHSLWENKRFSVCCDINKFIFLTENHKFDSALGLIEAEELSDYDSEEEKIMLSLRTNKGIFIKELSKKLSEFVKNGFADYSDGIFSLTDKGFFVSNTIIYYVCKELLYDK